MGAPQSWACWKKRRRRRSLPLRSWPPMDTKMQSLSSTHPHPSRSQGHPCNQCSCSHHCRSCNQAGHPSSSSSSSPSPPARHPKLTMHSRHSPKYRGCCSKSRKTLEGKVNKRKAVRRRKRTYRTKRRSPGTCPVEQWETLQPGSREEGHGLPRRALASRWRREWESCINGPLSISNF